jgi:hypothetical protein
MFVFHDQLFPFARQVVVAIELLDNDSLPTLAVSRGDVVTIHANADSATTEILAGSVASQRAGVCQVRLTSLDQTQIADEATDHHFLDGFSSVLLRHMPQIIACLPADPRQHRQELGISIWLGG